MKWEHELREVLRDLARSSDEVPANPETERRLLDAFEVRHRVPQKTPHPGWDRGFDSRNLLVAGARWVLPAAAALALLAGGWWGGTQWRTGFSQPVSGRVARRPVAPVAGAQPAAPESDSAGRSLPAATTPLALRPDASIPAAAPAHTARATVPSASSKVHEDGADEFITLPAAERLPPLESGMVVRVELPVTSLPAYGFPIMPDSGRRPVTADILVGQDGQPRAIRLVAVQTGTGRR